MTRWTLTPLRLSLLLGILSVVVLVLVLPQVDLLDTAFHRETAPGTIHARVTSAPSQLTDTTPTFQMATALQNPGQANELPAFTPITASYIPILHHSLRC
jgi:hypothetical protein